MNAKIVNGRTVVTLSERNLAHLQQMLKDGAVGGLRRQTDAGPLVIILERDTEHYGDRLPGPGYRRN